MSLIRVSLPRDRTQLGELSWWTDEPPVPCYAKSDNLAAAKRGNPARNPLLAYGDTPTGSYRCWPGKPGAADHATWRKFGPHGYIVMDPVGGPALEAKHNGRYGLLIHGGDLNSFGKLRPTFGCIRLHNEDMQRLMQAIAALTPDEQRSLTCEVLEWAKPLT